MRTPTLIDLWRSARELARRCLLVVDPRRDEYFIGGYISPADRVVVLYRGDLSTLRVPLDWFYRGARVDPRDFSIIDDGQTVCLGNFEAAGDAILFDFDLFVRARLEERECRWTPSA